MLIVPSLLSRRIFSAPVTHQLDSQNLPLRIIILSLAHPWTNILWGHLVVMPLFSTLVADFKSIFWAPSRQEPFLPTVRTSYALTSHRSASGSSNRNTLASRTVLSLKILGSGLSNSVTTAMVICNSGGRRSSVDHDNPIKSSPPVLISGKDLIAR